MECLVEHGWSGTSTTLVSHRAGVSRGAQLHHFPTKTDLVLAAVDHLSAVRQGECSSASAELPDRPGAPGRCSRCSPSTSPARCSSPRSSSGSPPAPTRRSGTRSATSSTGSAATRTAAP